MIINILVCRQDGEQVLEEREVEDTWFPSTAEETGTAL